MWWWLACAPVEQRYPLTGEVIEVRPNELVVAHEAVPGFMDAMTMPLPVAGAVEVAAGDRIAGTLVVGASTVLTDIRVVSRAESPPDLKPGEAVPVGAIFPAAEVMLAAGGGLTLGQGQEGPVAVTFLYTRCPLPEYCPATVAKLQALQALLPDGARIVAITLDPAHDTRGVLRDFAAASGAQAGRWDFARVPDEVLFGLAEKAGLKTAGDGRVGIVHDLVLLVLDREGRLVRRYSDHGWDPAQVAALLR